MISVALSGSMTICTKGHLQTISRKDTGQFKVVKNKKMAVQGIILKECSWMIKRREKGS